MGKCTSLALPDYMKNIMLPKVHPLIGIACVWITATACLFLLAKQLQSASTKSEIYFPHNMESLKLLTDTLHVMKQENWFLLLSLFCCAYLYKQAFAIPGSVFMNLLAGALFGWPVAFPLVCVLTAFGASACYLLSYGFGRKYLMSKFSTKISMLQRKVQANKDRLFFFLLSARLFPMSPNWFLNMASPIIGVPLHYFFISVLVGLTPYNFACTQAGSILSTISSVDDILTFPTVAGMLSIALVALLPAFFVRKVKA